MIIKPGSIIKAEARTQIDTGNSIVESSCKTLSVVDKVSKDKAICKHSVVSVDGGDYQPMSKVYSKYKGEKLSDVELIEPSDFNELIDTSLIPREVIVNVKT